MTALLIDNPTCEHCADRVAGRDDVVESVARHGVVLCPDCLGEADYMSTCDKCGSMNSQRVPPPIGSHGLYYFNNPTHRCRDCGNGWS